jgi:hypothetical protein
VICDDNEHEMENGVAYKNNLSGVLILEITSACRDKNKKNLALDFLFRREMKAGLTSLLGYRFLKRNEFQKWEALCPINRFPRVRELASSFPHQTGWWSRKYNAGCLPGFPLTSHALA